ncbi:hypothetical protein HG535_0D04250 [Zygotorulaspora mrakii]|uniref:Calcineurin-like phosphoesterase domain-containing protein n=1 Tax=Zygotorulaspora mrakii TaxID=42260 RepID=A0A7H9B2K4_ZYGMR|nr:uncharacterized protein HG535_0D04250 [Zygotorulaspora mrakii]QLG72717.1 hypothetical protein HG535_0D04250 [Zygotorulaspora mrakii]
MRLRRKRSIRSLNRTLVFTIVFAVFFFRAQLIFHIANIIFHPQTSEYQGGLIDDIQFIKCYRWFRQCQSLIRPLSSADRNLAAWARVSKNLSEETSYAIESGVLYDTYVYVHRWKKSSNSQPMTDLAISKDPLTVPLRVLSEVQKLIQSRDSSAFHKHIYQQEPSIWERFSPWNHKSKGEIHLLGEDWQYKGGGIWCKYESRNDPLVDIEVYLGAGFVESRPQWKEVISEYFRPYVKSNKYIPLSITKKVKSLSEPEVEPFDDSLRLKLPMTHDRSFKILQITDVHFRCSDDGTILLNEFQTVNFIINILDREVPDLVVITGDFLDGLKSFDYQACILKLVQPMIRKGISYAFSFGEADYSLYATETQITAFISRLPFCMNKWSSLNNHMAIDIKLNSGSDIVLYVLDSFKSVEPFFIERERLSLPKYSLAFRSLPIKEYRPEGSFPLIGQYNERFALESSLKIDSNLGDILKRFKIMAMSCGYEHNNDCCLKSNDEIWLCYGGSSGVGLGKMFDMPANVRVFNIDDDKGEITSWKRNFISVDSVYDYQYIRSVQ